MDAVIAGLALLRLYSRYLAGGLGQSVDCDVPGRRLLQLYTE